MKTLNRIMLIDDDPDTNFYNTLMLEQAGAAKEIIAFEEPKLALDYLETQNQKVDLILLDINMPVMNGWQFVELYQQLKEYQKSKIVIAMLSSSPNKEDLQRAENFQAIKKFVSKPVNQETIHDLLGLFE